MLKSEIRTRYNSERGRVNSDIIMIYERVKKKSNNIIVINIIMGKKQNLNVNVVEEFLFFFFYELLK